MDRRLALLVIAFLTFLTASAVFCAPLPRPPKLGPLSLSPKLAKKVRSFLIEHAMDLIDILQNLKKPGKRDQNNEAPATSTAPYIISLGVGTTPQNVSVILDITSELVWTQCMPCNACLEPRPPSFTPNDSNTFSVVPCASQECQGFVPQSCTASNDNSCSYTYMYGSSHNTTGFLGNDTFTFGTTSVADMLFGCGFDNLGDFAGASGIVGLGRGPLSLVSQLQLEKFSYYFAPDDSDSSNNFLLGDDAVPRTNNYASTPLLNSSTYTNLYFVELSSIKVDGEDLNIPAGTFDLQSDGSGGVFLSISIPVTLLENAAYELLKHAFTSKIGKPTVNGSALGLDLCYQNQSLAGVRIPEVTLVFANNAAMKLPQRNYFFMDASTGLQCLTILPSDDGSLLGSLLQNGMHMIYNVQDSKLIFKTAAAAVPSPGLMKIVSFIWVVVYILA